MSEPLAGIRVVEVQAGVAMATAGMLLRDAGATVVKLEPAGGDRSRREPGHRVWNRGKQSAVVEEGDPRWSRILAAADVVLIGGSAPERPAWEGRPEQIVALAPPYADAAPYRELAENDSLAAALSGVLAGTGAFREGPAFPTLPTLSYTVGVLVAAGVAAALHVRAKTGRGQTVRVPWPTAGAYLSAYQAAQSDRIPVMPSAGGASPLGLHAGWRVYEVEDGWMGVACPSPAFFDRFAIAIERPEITGDPRFQMAPFVRPEHAEELARMIGAALRPRTRAEWTEIFESYNVPAAAVLSREEFCASDLVEENGMLAFVDDPEVGRVRQIGIPFSIEDAALPAPAAAPALGADTETVAADSAPARAATGSEASPEHPLAGIRVLDFTGYLAGPTAGRLLAELGAEVIKVEPTVGEGLRIAVMTCVGINMGKKSLALDSSSAEGQEVRDRLLRSADVILQAMLPGAPEKLGIDYARVRELNDRIVYCSITGFGRAQHWRKRPSFDLLLQALSGQMLALGPDSPMYSSIPMADMYAGMTAVYSIVLALTLREQTGKGRAVSTNQVAASLGAQAGEFVEYRGMPAQAAFTADAIGACAVHRYYRLAEGWALLAADDEASWQRLVDAHPAELASWREWESAAAEPVDGKLAEALAALLVKRTRQEVLGALLPRGVPLVPVVIVREEGIANACFEDLGALSIADRHPQYGTITTVSNMIDFSETPAVRPVLAQWIGEQNGEILASLGYSPQEVEQLTAEGVIAAPELKIASL